MNFGKITKFASRRYKILKSKLACSNKPLFCMFAVTHRCNSRCAMCNFWKTRAQNELGLGEIKHLFSSKLFGNLISVSLTGGEPLLRKDITEIVDAIYETTGVKPSISTNGLLPERLRELLMARRDKIQGVGVSLDGLREMHNRIRGLPYAFDKVNASITVAKSFGFGPSVNMTISGLNSGSLCETYQAYRNEDFTFKIAQTSKFYYGDNVDLDLNLDADKKSGLLAQINMIKSSNLYNVFLRDFILQGKRPLPCYAGRFDIYIDAVGNIQPCIHMPALGNIRDRSIESIWLSSEAKQFRKRCKNCRCCYERCTASTLEVDWTKWKLLSLARQLAFLCYRIYRRAHRWCPF